MKYVREAGSDPAFLLKALSEASGELQRCFHGLRRRELLRPAEGVMEDGWCLMAIPFHVLEVERGVSNQLETMLSSREPEIRNVDFDDIPFREDYQSADEDELLEEFSYFRRRTSYILWDLSPGDFEHLWQARRYIDAMAGAVR